MKKAVIRVLIATLVLGAAWGGYRAFQQIPKRQEQVATAKVRRGDVIIRAYSRGELRPVRSVTLIAPNLFSTVQVTKLAPLGSLARDKDLIVEFDDSDRRATLQETLLEVDQIDEQIKKAEADLAIRTNQDQVDLLKARYAVRRAELEVQRNELLSAIDAKKNVLNLEEARRRLKQLESDVKSRQEQARAELAVLREQRNKSMIDVSRERQRIAQAKVLSPMTGLVAIRPNRTDRFYFPGMQVPEISEGDTLQPGVPVADVLDLSELEIAAKVGELDRANMREAQEALIQLDAMPEKRFHGRIKSMSGTATANVWSGDPGKKFDVVFSINMQEVLAALGAKSEDVRKILSTAERNAKKAPPVPALKAAGPHPVEVAPAGQSSEADLARAKLPKPPDEDSQLEVLLRPGLLADVEITVEKMANVIHIPAQAVFEKDGKQIAYVQTGKRFAPRGIQIARRSEATMVIAGGLQPGETIALADPNVMQNAKKDSKHNGPITGMPSTGGR